MEVTFVRTAERRYGVAVVASGRDRQWMNPGPGFDADIPHDLVHYLVESEARLTGGVFGRIAAGGALLGVTEQAADPRARRRRQQRARRREERLNRADREGPQEMARSERLAGICFLAWKARHGQLPRLPGWAAPEALVEQDRVVVSRVLDLLDRTAVLWHGLPIGDGIAFRWPNPDPLRVTAHDSPSPVDVSDGSADMIEAGGRRRNQPAPPRILFEALTEPNRDPARPWLRLLHDEQWPRINQADAPSLVVWSSLWVRRPEAVIRFDLPLDAAGYGTDLRWTLLLA